jgi:hypothetical protein
MAVVTTNWTSRPGGTAVPPTYYLGDTSAELPAATEGDLAYAKDVDKLYYYTSSWVEAGGGGGGGGSNIAYTNVANIFTQNQTVNGVVFATTMCGTQNTIAPTSGKSTELTFVPGPDYGAVFAYDRTAGAYLGMLVDGSYVGLCSSGSERMRITPSGGVNIGSQSDVGLGQLYVAGATTLAGTLDVTGGSGTDYSAAPIEIRTSAMPRISFHWPGVVASQIGMNSDGIIRTFDNPGTGYERFGAGSTTVYGTLTVTGATSLQGALTFAADVWHTTGADGWQRLLFTSGGSSYLKGSNVVFRNSSDADIGSIAANGDFMCSGSIGCTSNIWRSNCHTSGGYVYPANVAASAAVQSSWYIAGHSSYGLYINTGLYIVGGIWTGADILSGATVKAATSLWERGRSVCVGDPINWAPVFYTAEGANVGGSIACYYSLVGRTVFWSVYIINFSVGTATGYIRCSLPLACTLATYVQGACRNYVPGIGDRPGYSVAGVPDANWLAFYRCDVNAAAWPAGVGHILAEGFYWLP